MGNHSKINKVLILISIFIRRSAEQRWCVLWPIVHSKKGLFHIQQCVVLMWVHEDYVIEHVCEYFKYRCEWCGGSFRIYPAFVAYCQFNILVRFYVSECLRYKSSIWSIIISLNLQIFIMRLEFFTLENTDMQLLLYSKCHRCMLTGFQLCFILLVN